MIQCDLPIMYRKEGGSLWFTGRMPIYSEYFKQFAMRDLALCIEGVNSLFDVPDDAFMLQFVLTSKTVPNSHRVKIEDDGSWIYGKEEWQCFQDDDFRQFGKALLLYGRNVLYVSCFYWVVE